MKHRSFIIFVATLFISFQAFSQKSQMKIAQNTVGKLQAAIVDGKNETDQLKVIGEGIKAVENAQKDRRTKNWPETWAIKAYLSSYISLIDENESNADKYYNEAVLALDTAEKLDRFENNNSLIAAANYNLVLRKQEKANTAFKNNEFKVAFNLLKEVSDYFPTDTTLAINTGLSAQSINDYDHALYYYKRAKDNGAGNPTLFQSVASIYTSKFENDLAIQALEEGLIKNPYNTFINNDYINLLIDSEKYDKAIKAIDKTLNVDNQNKLLYFLYGYLHQQKDKNTTAELSYKKALDLDQNYFDALYQLGIAYVDMANSSLKLTDSTERTATYTANINRAELTLLQAYEINPNDKGTAQLLIDINTRKNRLDKVQELKRKLEEF
ncbi:tetratricopeptide (TPR) repeat protein [Pedobacter sp. CAN_A7]|uniref:tetratricopeptide repeat protein n=1 Tax=Pedobacter sp. CAN_A7 TaxID=2787722 RepID=UPI0018CB4F12